MSPIKATRPPADLDVILITIDCLRADMPWNGYARPIAPRLTELETRSVDYTHAYSISSYTSMSLGGLLGGKLPGELTRDGYFFGLYADKNLLFPEVLHDAGVRTMTGHAHGYFNGAGFKQGFDAFEVVADLKWSNTTDDNITSPQLEAIAEKQLGDPLNDSKRFFAWYHFTDPHDGYKPHEGISYGPKARDYYDGEVTFTDQYIGKLLDFIAQKSWGKRTAIIVSADHGEAFGEHKQFVHGFELWENLVRVPLLVVVPGANHARIEHPVSAIDLAPTILDLFGLPPQPGFEGRSLVPELFGVADAMEDGRLVAIDLPQTSDNDKRRAIVFGRYKLIAFGITEYMQVFDLEADAEELKPITSGDVYDDMVKRFRSFEKTIVDVPPTSCKEGCLNGAYNKPKDAGAK